MHAIAAPAMGNFHQSTIHGGLNQIARVYWRETGGTGQRMSVIAV
jgi:hypothetical protein